MEQRTPPKFGDAGGSKAAWGGKRPTPVLPPMSWRDRAVSWWRRAQAPAYLYGPLVVALGTLLALYAFGLLR